MNFSASERMRALYAGREEDPEYQFLEAQRRAAEPGFLAVLGSLKPDQRDILMDYIGVLQEQEMRMLELACFLGE